MIDDESFSGTCPTCGQKYCASEIRQLKTALQQIINEADSDDGLTAWDGADIARRALEQRDN